MVEEIRKKLHELSEEDYKTFNQKLLPGVEHVLGVRLPAMRKLAKEVAKGDFRSYLDEAAEKIGADSIHEEIMLQGLVLGYAKMDREERTEYLEEFVPKITNWAVCDTVCCAAKWAGHKGTDKNRLWDFLGNLRDSDREFEVRFATIMTMCYFLEPEWLPGVFKETDRIDFGRIRSKYIPIAEKKSLQANCYAKAAEPETVPCGYGYCLSGSRTGTVPEQSPYYVRMGVAWLLATALAKFPEQTREYVRTCNLPDDVVRLYVRKAKESFRTRDTDPL